MLRTSTIRLTGAILALLLVAAACGDDDGGDSTTTTDAGSDNGGAAPDGPDEDVLALLDANDDGQIVIGVATPGPRDDGGYYESLVTGVERISAENGFGTPIIVDEIAPSDAATELENLARQNVDIIAVGASEIGDSLPQLAEEYSDIFWYCNCGAGAPPDPNFAQSQDSAGEINFTAGYATGLLMQERGDGTRAAFIGNQGFNFEIESFLAFEAGLQEVDPSFTLDRIDTGSFNDVAAATEAATSASNAGAIAIYPFLGGALEAVVSFANENDIITMSAGASDVCDRTDLDYQIAVRFDAADYLTTIFEEILSGELVEGDIRFFRVGIDPQPGAVICDATDEQQAAMDEVYQRIADGELEGLFGQIAGEAYG